MAKYIKPLYDFNKFFEIHFKNYEEYEKFDKNGGIWGYKPFQEYMENFDNTYGYWITYSTEHGLFGKSTNWYTVHICKITE